ncbi:MAG TPA: hypothetical protein VIO33_01035 [Burkholderiaceae bacterium]
MKSSLMSTIESPMKRAWPRAMAIALAGLAGALLAQAATQPGMPIVYPAKGQSPQQQDQDKYQCYGWSREQSGFDPMQPTPAQQSQATPSPSAQPQAAAAQTGSGTGGLVKGAAMGAAVGELAHHDAGRGAAAGALGGVALQNIQQRQAAQARQQQAQAAQQQQTQQQQAARQQQKATFDRAFGACMEARGYAVK